MKDTTNYKEMLLREKAEIENELLSIGGRLDPATGDWEVSPDNSEKEADENDQADKFEDYEEKSVELDALEKRLHHVINALVKIEGNTFGTCEVCGKEIEEERLNANPAARTCMEHLND